MKQRLRRGADRSTLDLARQLLQGNTLQRVIPGTVCHVPEQPIEQSPVALMLKQFIRLGQQVHDPPLAGTLANRPPQLHVRPPAGMVTGRESQGGGGLPDSKSKRPGLETSSSRGGRCRRASKHRNAVLDQQVKMFDKFDIIHGKGGDWDSFIAKLLHPFHQRTVERAPVIIHR